MRLSPAERHTIRQIVDHLTGGQGKVWLFGSRTDDAARGGDIDLLVECPEPVDHPARLMASIGAQLEMALGERRIDVLLQAPNLRQLPVHRVARETGVLL